MGVALSPEAEAGARICQVRDVLERILRESSHASLSMAQLETEVKQRLPDLELLVELCDGFKALARMGQLRGVVGTDENGRLTIRIALASRSEGVPSHLLLTIR